MDRKRIGLFGDNSVEKYRILIRMQSAEYYSVGWGGSIVGLNQLPHPEGIAILRDFTRKGWVRSYVTGDVRHWRLTEAGRQIIRSYKPA